MLYTTVDARDGTYSAICNKCCCEPMNMRPGETNSLMVNYAPWAVPLTGRGMGCTPQFNVEQVAQCPVPTGDNLPPTATDPIVFAAVAGTPLSDDLKDQITDPDGDTMTFELLPFYGPDNGKLTLNADGTFEYTAMSTFTGYDRFFVKVSDGHTAPVIFEVIMAVGVPTTDAKSTPGVSVPFDRVSVDSNSYMLTLAVQVSPAARPCDAYRLTIRQNAYDCNWNCYWHVSCYDIVIRQC